MKSSKRNERTKYWQGLVTEAEDYSGSLSQFCKEQGLNQHTFQYWRKKLGCLGRVRSTKQIVAVPPFARVEIDPPKMLALPEARWVAELILHLHSGAGR